MADVDDQQLPQPIRFLTYIHLGREKEYFPKLVDCLRADCESWESLLPAGNVAHGLAWSYYFGYLKVLLPGIDNRIERSEWWGSRQDSRMMSRKLYLLFPVSCMCKDTLCDDDDSITHAGHLETIVRNRAGTVGRSYQSTVYKITDHDMKEWFFVGEYVTAIHTMYEMEMNSHFSGLQTDDKYLQATRFLITIRNILEKDPHCRGRYKFLPYTGETSFNKY
ncbi:hypothetical protein FSP39_007393 [Pinctada imbricata]|uniref:STING ligand-binding domain-containing protein n=1 Tax=Pinctada imbricata TaxID=66713 RepID=A0AA89BU98_PINIB|nr:hypothetical protein FSP39_007393 [Pinctada imbricata]